MPRSYEYTAVMEALPLQSPKASLTSLPVELRLSIFEYVTAFDAGRVFLVESIWLRDSGNSLRSFCNFSRTNKKIYQEVKKVFYNRTTFEIDVCRSLYVKNRGITHYELRLLSSFRDVVVMIGIDSFDLCCCQDLERLPTVRDVLSESIQLRRLRFRFSYPGECILPKSSRKEQHLHDEERKRFMQIQQKMEVEAGMQVMGRVEYELQRMTIVVEVIRELLKEKGQSN